MKSTLMAAAILSATLPAAAVTTDNFLARNTADILALCSAADTDPIGEIAVNFCQGYLVGAFQFYTSEGSGPGGSPRICLPNPPPTRNEGVAMFVAWAGRHPEYAGERGVDTFARFLDVTFPCKR